ncbi:P-loop containing nucleoside triphosphate hydrolase protein [Auricularia subglabra TFB-10046 SS5]|nr:P-loop containing nucleoside triphosphate hydrolase protein [Auricularia subglabra TFB-10046 SS5]
MHPEPTAPAPAHAMTRPVVLVLCGLVGSGKSTLAQALEEHFPETWTRCCQDELKSRRKVEAAAREALQAGVCPVIDRTNVTADQRATWVDIAREFNVPAWLLFVNTPPEQCAQRVLLRRGHPTVEDGTGIGLIRRFGASFEPPHHSEGFARVLEVLPTSIDPSFTAEELNTILARLYSSTLDPAAAPLRLSGPLPPPPERKGASPKKPATVHGRDIRTMFPPASEELSRRRLLSKKDGAGTRSGSSAGTSVAKSPP